MNSLCVLCDKQLGNAYIRNEWGEEFCPSHSNVEGCLWCGSHRKLKIDQGMHACGECWSEVVTDDAGVADCAETVMNWLSQVVGQHSLQDVPIIYGGLTLPPPSGGTLGWTESKWTGAIGSSEISTVGLIPRASLIQLLAHEYAHVLLLFDPHSFQLHPNLPKEDLVIEGFCEVVSSEMLRFLGDPRSTMLLERMERNRNPIYGDGYRKMLPEMHKTGGVVPLYSSLTGWRPSAVPISTATQKQPVAPPTNPVVPPNPSAAPRSPSIPIPATAPRQTPQPSVPARPAPIPMRPVVKRTDKPQTIAEHRPHLVMPAVGKRAVADTSELAKPVRPTIPMKLQQ